jgi:predicted NBD/HSP70 family sugar kinase
MTQGSPGTPQVLRAMNDRAALEVLLAHGPLPRSRVGSLTGLSKPTAGQLLARLEAAGLVVVTGTDAGRPGPNARLYGVNPRAAHVAGLDVTAAGISAAVADLTGRTAGTCTLAAGGRRDGHDTVERVVRAVDGAAAAAGLDRSALHRVVVGTPGAFDPRTGRLRYAAHLPGWHGPALLEELAGALAVPLEHDNDVNLVAVAEQRRGAVGAARDAVLLWNEEGIGAALVLGGTLHRGWTGGAGEVGFLPVPGTPLVRGAGRAGSGGFQELAGAAAVLRLARALELPYPRGVPDHDAAAAVLSAAADAAAADGTEDGNGEDGGHAELLRRFATATAVGLAALVCVLDPELVVLAGGVLAAGGEPLRGLVAAELAVLAAARPPLRLGTVTDRPVLTGALERALAVTRDEVFDTSRRDRRSPSP